MTPIHRLAGAMLAVALSLPGAASAQEQDAAARGQQLSLISSGTSTTSVSITGLGLFMVNQREGELRKKIQIMKAISKLDRYLERNRASVRMALAIGAGDELQEIAQILGHPDPLNREQRSALRRGRKAVLGALAIPASEGRARRVFALLSTAIWRPAEVPA